MAAHLDILTFHRVMPAGQRYFIPPMAMDERTFAALIEHLGRSGRVITLEEGVRQLQEGGLLGHRVAVTFDDGYRDNYELAAPILRRFGVPATFFVPVLPIEEGQVYWWDHLQQIVQMQGARFFSWVATRCPVASLQRAPQILDGTAAGCSRPLVQVLNCCSETERSLFLRALTAEFGPWPGQRQLMNWEEIRWLQKEGFAIGSHSLSHTPLTDLDGRAAQREIATSALLLEERLGLRPGGFCYPRGACTEAHARMAQAGGYRYAVTTCYGNNGPQADLFALRRRGMADYQGVRARFPLAMHLLEISGGLDWLLSRRRAA